jgi:hypothetical protein
VDEDRFALNLWKNPRSLPLEKPARLGVKGRFERSLLPEPLQKWKSRPTDPRWYDRTILTAFNDNAAITYLASLVPGFSDPLKYVVMAGAVTGGGLTVIANSPNPAGQSILASRFGENGVSPLYLFLGALVPTLIDGAAFMLLH